MSERKITSFHFSGENGFRFFSSRDLREKNFFLYELPSLKPLFSRLSPLNPKFQENFKFHVKRLLRMMMVVRFFYGDSFRVYRGDDDLVA